MNVYEGQKGRTELCYEVWDNGIDDIDRKNRFAVSVDGLTDSLIIKYIQN